MLRLGMNNTANRQPLRSILWSPSRMPSSEVPRRRTLARPADVAGQPKVAALFISEENPAKDHVAKTNPFLVPLARVTSRFGATCYILTWVKKTLQQTIFKNEPISARSDIITSYCRATCYIKHVSEILTVNRENEPILGVS